MAHEQRVFTRVPFGQAVRWQDANGHDGTGILNNVSRSGFSVLLKQYLRPGPAILFTFDDVRYADHSVELAAVTMWCKPVPNDPERFNAGFLVVHGEPQTLGAISEVFYAALAANAAGQPG